MLILRPRNGDLNGLRASLLELGLSQRNIRLRRHPTREPHLGQRQVLRKLIDRARKQPRH